METWLDVSDIVCGNLMLGISVNAKFNPCEVQAAAKTQKIPFLDNSEKYRMKTNECWYLKTGEGLPL